MYTILVSLDTMDKMKGFLNEESERSSILRTLNVAVDSNNTLLSFMQYNKFECLPVSFVFDKQEGQADELQWNGNPNSQEFVQKGEYQQTRME